MLDGAEIQIVLELNGLIIALAALVVVAIVLLHFLREPGCNRFSHFLCVVRTHCLLLLHKSIGKPNGFEFNPNGTPQLVKTIIKYIRIRLIKLILHHVQVLNRQREHLRLVLALDCEVPLQILLMGDPVVDVELNLMAQEVADDASNAEAFALVQVDVCEVLVPRQDVAGLAFLEEVDAFNVILLVKDVLVFA